MRPDRDERCGRKPQRSRGVRSVVGTDAPHASRVCYGYGMTEREWLEGSERRWLEGEYDDPRAASDDDALYDRLGQAVMGAVPDADPWSWRWYAEDKESWRQAFAAILCHLVDEEGWTPGTPEICPVCDLRFTEENDRYSRLHTNRPFTEAP